MPLFNWAAWKGVAPGAPDDNAQSVTEEEEEAPVDQDKVRCAVRLLFDSLQ